MPSFVRGLIVIVVALTVIGLLAYKVWAEEEEEAV